MIPDQNDQTIIKQLHLASNTALRMLDRRLKPLGVSSSQYFFVLKLHDNPGVTQDQLVQADTRHQSNVNREISRLVALGLVVKQQSRTDGRRYELFLTAAGAALYPQVKAALDQQEAVLHECLATAAGQGSQPDFMAVLHQIAQLDTP
ncbi:MarR family winged helix-turn-helix transcriptional regulator [Lacticaseibacillus baoqingensis]|uniref:MarR family winged helix-turn-helix transcriptional regulator n=1 Tax=Lacticaseibacillus baoqingensis TaxID=2486013 RepID=A0ABW4E5N3_9LACO|nr:MarR family transcriptional regulator [Lacticaseibacillus baoqingensis]